jgi:hypothetical protein
MAVTYPGAEFRPLGPQTQDRISAHDIVCLHTMAGSLAGTAATFAVGGLSGTESHFGIGARGEVVQWQDLMFRADANLDGNHRLISIETADKGAPFPDWEGSDVPAWTRAQVDSIVELVAWLCGRLDIPATLIPDSRPDRRGIGYHRQGIPGSFRDGLVPSGERWSDDFGKVCPGDRRIRQLKRTVMRRVSATLADGPAGAETAVVRVDLTRVLKAAEGGVIPGVRIVERALVAEGLLDKQLADGVWGPGTTEAYAAWQRKCGFSGAAADGVPGEESLRLLGEAHDFVVRH